MPQKKAGADSKTRGRTRRVLNEIRGMRNQANAAARGEGEFPQDEVGYVSPHRARLAEEAANEVNAIQAAPNYGNRNRAAHKLNRATGLQDAILRARQ